MPRLPKGFKPKRITGERAGFIQGYACAIANLHRMHGDCTELRDLIKSAGYKLADFKAAKVDSYDIETLEKIELYSVGF